MEDLNQQAIIAMEGIESASSPPSPVSAVAGNPPTPKPHDNEWAGVALQGEDLQLGQNTRYRQGQRQTDVSFLYPESESHRRTKPSVSLIDSLY